MQIEESFREGGGDPYLRKLPASDEILFADDEWLAVSLEGFSQQNAARPVEHLVKELVQNSLDALPCHGGRITLSVSENTDGKCVIECQDDGQGIVDMENLRTVFWTSKQDSRFKRGRMGRGFKELLSLCHTCEVRSGDKISVFHFDKLGKRKFSILRRDASGTGTSVYMVISEDFVLLRDKLKSYFSKFLPPAGVEVVVCGTAVSHRKPARVFRGSLLTEEFQEGRWIKAKHKTEIEIVKTDDGEIGSIYEMGIPICHAGWDIPYHVNILQRVPMNPNRDAVMNGYPLQVHKACLPHLIDEISSEKTRDAWVGEAASKCGDEDLQKKVLSKAFGENLARSVPDFGKFSHDADAQENSGVSILDTKQLTGGFREIARKHVPTSADVAKKANLLKHQMAVREGVDAEQARALYEKLVTKRGVGNVKNACEFYKWMADGILKTLFPQERLRCKVKVADFQGTAEATWTNQFQTLTLALDLDRIWDDPTHHDNFALIVHETAHELAAHHGRSFASAMEATAGAACSFLFHNSQMISQWEFPASAGTTTLS